MQFSRHTSRALAIGLAILCGLSVWHIYFRPVLRAIEADRAVLAARAADESDANALQQTLPKMRAALAQLRAARSLDDIFQPAANPTLLFASFQGKIASLTAASGATLLSSRSYPIELEHGHRRLSADVDVTATTPALQALLHSIETDKPLLTVDRLTIAGIAVADDAKGRESPLRAQLRISAYAQASHDR